MLFLNSSNMLKCSSLIIKVDGVWGSQVSKTIKKKIKWPILLVCQPSMKCFDFQWIFSVNTIKQISWIFGALRSYFFIIVIKTALSLLVFQWRDKVMKVWNNMKAGKLFHYFFLFRPTISWMHTAVMTEEMYAITHLLRGHQANCYVSLEKARNREALKVSDRNRPLLDA